MCLETPVITEGYIRYCLLYNCFKPPSLFLIFNNYKENKIDHFSVLILNEFVFATFIDLKEMKQLKT